MPTATTLALALHQPGDERHRPDPRATVLEFHATAHAAGLPPLVAAPFLEAALLGECIGRLQDAAAVGRTESLVEFVRPLLPEHPSTVGLLGPILDHRLDGRDPDVVDHRQRARKAEARLVELRRLG